MNTLLLIAILVVVLLVAIRQGRGTTAIPEPKNEVELKIMITIPDNDQDRPITASLGGDYTDEEGAKVPVSLVDPSSTNEDAYSFLNTTNSGTGLATSGHAGGPGLATVTFAVKRDDTGEIVQQKSFDVKVVAGAVVNAPPLNIDLGGLVDA